MSNFIFMVMITFTLLGCGHRQNVQSKDNLNKHKFADNQTKTSESTKDVKSKKRVIPSLRLSRFVLVGKGFKNVLDRSIEEYNHCESKEKGYYFSIFIFNAEIRKKPTGESYLFIKKDNTETCSSDIKSVLISRSYFQNYISGGYGYFYYKNYLFVLAGVECSEIFQKTGVAQFFEFKSEPAIVFDPPRWHYYYQNSEFHLINSSPCGG